MEDLLGKIPEQIREAARLGNKKFRGIEKIIVCGMGASGITGDILKDLVREKIILVNKDYEIPRYVDRKTLAFIVSYSGNTEETISNYQKIKKKTKNIAIITSGGKLGREKEAVIVPGGLPPRYALHYLFFPMLKTLERSKIIGKQDSNINETIKVMKSLKKQQTKKLAEGLKGKTPIVCTQDRYRSVAVRWREQFNENSKVLAIQQTLPELDHNTLEGFNTQEKKFELIVIRDKDEEKREKKRVEITEKMIAKKIQVDEVWMRGKSELAKIFYAIHFGDYTSYHLGLLKKENPYENKMITFLKKQLKKAR